MVLEAAVGVSGPLVESHSHSHSSRLSVQEEEEEEEVAPHS